MRRSGIIGSLVLCVLLATACAKVLGIKDAEVEAPSCGYSTSDSCMRQCIDTQCCSETSVCMGFDECAALVSCVADCDGSDSACESDCIDSYSAALSLFREMSTCIATCDCSTSGSGGASSGQGGASSGGTSGTGSGGTGGGNQLLNNAITRFAEADCAKYQACAPGWLSIGYGGVAECVARETLQYQWITTLPGVGWKASDFVACGAAWTAASCADYMNGTPLTACIVAGTLALDEPCNSNYQCASLFCDSDGTSCGVCVAAPAVGQACINGVCDSGLVCSLNDVCQKPRGLREACSDDYPCQPRLDCYQGQCALPSITAGTSCDSSINLNCDLGQNYVCALTTDKCVNVASYAAAGQSCGVESTNTSATMCSRGSCDSSTGLCVSRAADHGTCDSSLGPYCEWPAFCYDGTCQLESDIATCR